MEPFTHVIDPFIGADGEIVWERRTTPEGVYELIGDSYPPSWRFWPTEESAASPTHVVTSKC